jgi:hypothetical protein
MQEHPVGGDRLHPPPPDAAIPAGMKPGRSRRRCSARCGHPYAARAGARQRPRWAWPRRRAVPPQGCSLPRHGDARKHRAALQRGLEITARGGPGWKASAEPCGPRSAIEGAVCQDDLCEPFSRLVLEFATTKIGVELARSSSQGNVVHSHLNTPQTRTPTEIGTTRCKTGGCAAICSGTSVCSSRRRWRNANPGRFAIPPPFVHSFSAGPIFPPTPLPPHTPAFARSAPANPCGWGEGRRGRLCPRPDLARARNVASAHSRPHRCTRARFPTCMSLRRAHGGAQHGSSLCPHCVPDLARMSLCGTRRGSRLCPAPRAGSLRIGRRDVQWPSRRRLSAAAYPRACACAPSPGILGRSPAGQAPNLFLGVKASHAASPCDQREEIQYRLAASRAEVIRSNMRYSSVLRSQRGGYGYAEDAMDMQTSRNAQTASEQNTTMIQTNMQQTKRSIAGAQRASFSGGRGGPSHSSLTSRPH